MSSNPIEMIVANAVDQAVRDVTAHANAAIAVVVDQINQNQTLPNIPRVEIPTPQILVETPPAAIEPSTAAARTILQGVIATILGAAGGVVVEALSDDQFQVFDLGDWKGVGNGALTAALMAVIAFAMRKFGR